MEYKILDEQFYRCGVKVMVCLLTVDIDGKEGDYVGFSVCPADRLFSYKVAKDFAKQNAIKRLESILKKKQEMIVN